MAYELTNWSNVSNMRDFLAVANTTTAGWFWNVISLMFFIIIFITMSMAAGYEVAIMAAAFIGLIIQILLVYLGLGSMLILGGYVAILLLMFIYITWRNKYD
jgi:hypothetical protein